MNKDSEYFDKEGLSKDSSTTVRILRDNMEMGIGDRNLIKIQSHHLSI
jgi:hypothetical protein